MTEPVSNGHLLSFFIYRLHATGSNDYTWGFITVVLDFVFFLPHKLEWYSPLPE